MTKKELNKQIDIFESAAQIRERCKMRLHPHRISNNELIAVAETVRDIDDFAKILYRDFLFQLLADIPIRGYLQLDKDGWVETGDRVMEAIGAVSDMLEGK